MRSSPHSLVLAVPLRSQTMSRVDRQEGGSPSGLVTSKVATIVALGNLLVESQDSCWEL